MSRIAVLLIGTGPICVLFLNLQLVSYVTLRGHRTFKDKYISVYMSPTPKMDNTTMKLSVSQKICCYRHLDFVNNVLQRDGVVHV